MEQNLKTERVPVKELNPGDKLQVKWPQDREKPSWWKLPEILTVKYVELSGSGGMIIICESGGICLNGIETEFFNRVIEEPSPEPGDEISFSELIETKKKQANQQISLF